MRISILVPVYKVEKYIKRCATSLFSQTDIENVEFIFVNDCTPDKSIEYLKETVEEYNVSEKVKIIHHKKNRGLAVARNTGIKSATGDYLLFLDSDDTLKQNCISILKNAIVNQEPDLLVFGMQLVYSDGTQKIVGGNNICTDKYRYIENVISRNCLVTACGKLFSKRLFDNVQFIEGLNYGEDYATLPRLIYYSKNISDLSDIILYNYHQDNLSSYTKSIIGRKQIDNIYLAINILKDFFKEETYSNLIDRLLVIRNKVFLLEYVSAEFRDEILEKFSEYNRYSVKMPLKHQIVWTLSRKKMFSLLKIFLNFSQWLKVRFQI